MKLLCSIALSLFVLGNWSCVQMETTYTGYDEKNSVQLYIKNFGATVQQINADLVAEDIKIKGDTQGETYVIVRVAGHSVSKEGISMSELQQRIDKYYDVQIQQQNDKTLYISVKQKMNNVPNSESLGFYFEVHTPNSASATVKSVSGDVDIDRISGADITSVSGDIEVDNISGSLVASSTSGDIEGKNIASVNNLHTVSGDIKIEVNTLSNNATLSSVSGDVHLNLPITTQADVALTSVSGEVHIGNMGATHYSTQKSNTIIGTINAGGKSLSVNTTSGNISIN